MAVLTSTHNLCFRAKVRKECIHMLTPVILYKSGVRGCKSHGRVILMSVAKQAVSSLTVLGTMNKNRIMSSFKSSRDIQKKEGGPHSCFG